MVILWMVSFLNVVKQQERICVNSFNSGYYQLLSLSSEQGGILFTLRSSRREQTFQIQGKVEEECSMGPGGTPGSGECLLLEKDSVKF